MRRIYILLIAVALLLIGLYGWVCSNNGASIQISDHSLQVNGLNTFYRTAGNPENKTIVFTPGWAARNTSQCIKGNDSIIEVLANHFYVVMYEPPGLMRSEPPTDIWSFDSYADHLRLLLNLLEIEKPLVMGQSFGGGVSTAYAKLHPDNVDTLILVDSTMADRDKNWYYNLRFPWNAFVKKALPSKLVPLSVKKLIASGYFGTPLEMISSENVSKWTIVADIQQAYDLEVNYAELQMPVIMVWGKEDTYITPIDQARRVNFQIPNSKLIELEGGHTVLFKKPTEVIEKILLEL